MTRSYPSYKDSGYEWLNRVPSSWPIVRLRTCFEERREKVSDREFPPLSVTMQGVVPQIETAAKTDDGDNRKLVRAGDLAINSRSDRMGSSGLAKQDGSISLINTVLVPNAHIVARFAECVLRSRPFQHEFYRWGRGIVADLWTTRYSDMRDIRLALPSVEEQRAIAAFLNRETAKIDALVEEQRRLIALLKEKRQAVISHAVTKGLDPTVPMKPSGIDWLGDVPAHWQLFALKRLATIRYGIGEPPDYKDEGVPLIRATNVDHGHVRPDGMVFVDPAGIPERRILWLQFGDIIVVRSGAYTGDSAIITSKDVPSIAGFDMVLRPSCSEPMFLQYALLSRYLKNDQIDLEKLRAAQPHLNAEELGSCMIMLPPPIEQQAIVNFLDCELLKIDGLVSEAETAIGLLQERRSALISAAVTGKIDVRDAVDGTTEAA